MNPFVNEFPMYETLANGNAIIMIYDLFILLLFLFELFLFYNKERVIFTLLVNSGLIKQKKSNHSDVFW